tara:strand:- start:199 stop:474 length:276 start_codon:yes stop_codon:yes gene_type:complete
MSSARTGSRLLPIWLIWAILVGASIMGFLFGEGMAGARLASIIAVLLAAVKIHLVFGQYMEVQWHHRPLRLLLTLWLAVVTAIILGEYLLI